MGLIDLTGKQGIIGGDLNSWSQKINANELELADGVNELYDDILEINGISTGLGLKLDKDGYTGTAQDLKDGIDLKQNITDNTLNTTNKTVTRAINEVNNDLSDHVGNILNPHSVTKAQVGLGNVENTSDLTKLTVTEYVQLNTSDKTIIGAINEVNTIKTNEVDNSQLAQMSSMTIKGNNEIITGNAEDLTVSEVQTMINGDISSNLTTSSKTIVGAINELNANISLIDTRAIMGVKFIDNGAGFNAERYGIAKGKTFSYSTNGNTTTINSDFDTMPIYKYMRRGIFDNNSVLVFDQDAVGYDDTLSTGGLAPHTHWVGVYIPKFYFRINVTFAPTYVKDIAVSDKAFDGSLVHPVFTQHSNTGVLIERDYVVFSAYEGVLVNKSTGAYLFTDRADSTTRIISDFQVGIPSGLINYTNYAMTSVNKANAQAPATNGNLSNFRTMAQNRSIENSSGRAITQQQYLSWTAINTLFMVEFASTDWQEILSAGVTNLGSGTRNESVSVGHTSSLKNKSGYIAGIVRGSLGTTQVPSYRGIENFFGNVWKFMEGFKGSSTVAQYGVYNITKTNDYSVYSNLDFTNKKEVALMTTTNYYKYRNEELMPTNSTLSSAYVPDEYHCNTVGQTALSGALWYDGSGSGGFAVSLIAVFGFVDRAVGSRVFS